MYKLIFLKINVYIYIYIYLYIYIYKLRKFDEFIVVYINGIIHDGGPIVVH